MQPRQTKRVEASVIGNSTIRRCPESLVTPRERRVYASAGGCHSPQCDRYWAYAGVESVRDSSHVLASATRLCSSSSFSFPSSTRLRRNTKYVSSTSQRQ